MSEFNMRGNKTNVRRYRGGGPRPDLNEIHRKEAQERLAAWQALSPKAQLEAIAYRQKSGRDSGKSERQIVRIVSKLPKE